MKESLDIMEPLNMTREEKCKLAIERGVTYDPITGKIYGVRGTEIVNTGSMGYITIQISDGKKYHSLLGHHLAWYIIYDEIVDRIDHINRNRSDNRLSNLRSVTHQQNSFNVESKGYTYRDTSKKFISQIAVSYKKIYLGSFEKEEDARQAYLDAKKIYHII